MSNEAKTKSAKNILIGDIGGTNIRLGIVGAGGRLKTQIYNNKIINFLSLEDALRDFLRQTNYKPTRALLGVNGPVSPDGTEVYPVNTRWAFKADAIKTQLGLDTTFINDFVLKSYGVLALKRREYVKLGGKEPVKGAVMAVIGPGTGVGAGFLIAGADGKYKIYASEAGHATITPRSPAEEKVWRAFVESHAHVSAERVGALASLPAIFQLLGGETLQPEQVTTLAMAGNNMALQAFYVQLGFIGTAAGNLALTVKALGGVYIVAEPLADCIDLVKSSPLYENFISKGRFRKFMEQIPLYLVTGDDIVMRGVQLMAKEAMK